jgi:hypothetical protein
MAVLEVSRRQSGHSVDEPPAHLYKRAGRGVLSARGPLAPPPPVAVALPGPPTRAGDRSVAKASCPQLGKLGSSALDKRADLLRSGIMTCGCAE